MGSRAVCHVNGRSGPAALSVPERKPVWPKVCCRHRLLRLQTWTGDGARFSPARGPPPSTGHQQTVLGVRVQWEVFPQMQALCFTNTSHVVWLLQERSLRPSQHPRATLGALMSRAARQPRVPRLSTGRSSQKAWGRRGSPGEVLHLHLHLIGS